MFPGINPDRDKAAERQYHRSEEQQTEYQRGTEAEDRFNTKQSAGYPIYNCNQACYADEKDGSPPSAQKKISHIYDWEKDHRDTDPDAPYAERFWQPDCMVDIYLCYGAQQSKKIA